MPRIDGQIAGEGEQAAHAIPQLRPAAAGEIGAADAAAEQGIAREQRPFRAEAHPARRVPRGRDDGKTDAAQIELVAAAEGKVDGERRDAHAHFGGEVILREDEGQLRLAAADARPRPLQRRAAADVVEVPVRQQDGADGKPPPLRLGERLGPAAVDEDGVFAVLRQQIGIGPQNARGHADDVHVSLLFQKPMPDIDLVLFHTNARFTAACGRYGSV